MKLRSILAASAALLISAVTAQAAQVAALTGDKTIAIVDTAAKKVVKTWDIQGVNGKVVGIDVRMNSSLSITVKKSAFISGI